MASERGSVQKVVKGSDIGRMESPEGELCSLAEQPNHHENSSFNCKLSRSKETRRRLVGEATQEC